MTASEVRHTLIFSSDLMLKVHLCRTQLMRHLWDAFLILSAMLPALSEHPFFVDVLPPQCRLRCLRYPLNSHSMNFFTLLLAKISLWASEQSYCSHVVFLSVTLILSSFYCLLFLIFLFPLSNLLSVLGGPCEPLKFFLL